jgi:hypothetical protein
MEGAAGASPTPKPKIVLLGHSCYSDSISAVNSDGAIVKMMSGAIYEIDDAGRSDTALWLPADDALVCVQHGTVNGHAVSVYTLRDKDSDGDDPEGYDARRLR